MQPLSSSFTEQVIEALRGMLEEEVAVRRHCTTSQSPCLVKTSASCGQLMRIAAFVAVHWLQVALLEEVETRWRADVVVVAEHSYSVQSPLTKGKSLSTGQLALIWVFQASHFAHAPPDDVDAPSGNAHRSTGQPSRFSSESTPLRAVQRAAVLSLSCDHAEQALPCELPDWPPPLVWHSTMTQALRTVSTMTPFFSAQ